MSAPSGLKTVTLTAFALGVAALGFALWQLLVVADSLSGLSLSGLWLVFWAMVFGPVFLVLGAAHLWRASRGRGRPRVLS